ncbi:MAG: hypothetical protein EAX95_08515 [Candidatus Thorarchaeota archaeon]|nr:hypothetical protein [Candidatus Thorarchaeota archaeon]
MGKLDEIAKTLDEIGIIYSREKSGLLMVWDTEQFDDLKILILTSPDENWLFITALFTSFSNIPEEQRYQLMHDMLTSSWKVNGVKFVITTDDYLAVTAETNDTDLTGAELRILIDNTVRACDVLARFCPGYGA